MSTNPYTVSIGCAELVDPGIWKLAAEGLTVLKEFSTRQAAEEYAAKLVLRFPQFRKVSGPGIEDKVVYLDRHGLPCDEFGNFF